MKIGFLQFAPEINNLQGNIANIRMFIEQAPDFDLLVLPELSNSGYNFSSRDEAMQNAEEADNSLFVDALKDLCKKRNAHIVTGFCEKENDKLYNSALLINKDGVKGKYRKIHLFCNELDIFEPGNCGLPVFDIGECKIGILICFDWMFPEVWRILAMKGAQIICHPSNLVLPFAQKAVPTHALINRVFTITANRVGTEGELTFTGQSVIANPKSDILEKASPSAEEIVITFIDELESNNKMITNRNHVFGDRREDQYIDLFQSENKRYILGADKGKTHHL